MATTVQLKDLTDYYQADATQDMPDFSVLTSTGFIQDGDPVAGRRATLMGAAWFNLVAAMRVSVIKAAGLTPSKTPDPLQFLTALQSMAWMQDKKIATAMLADGLVTAAKLASNAVETAKIKDKAVTTEKLADDAVTAAKLAADAVVTANILNGNVTFAKLAAAAIATQEQAIAGTANNVLMTPQRVAQAIEELLPPSVPTGAFMFFHATTPPEGWLACNGQQVSRTTYAALFAVIGTKYGAGDGSTTFTLPNLHHRFLEGTTTVSEVGKTVEAGLPNITGEVQLERPLIPPNFTKTGPFSTKWAGSYRYSFEGQWGNQANDTIVFSANSSSSFFGKASSVQPASLRLLPCIKF